MKNLLLTILFVLALLSVSGRNYDFKAQHISTADGLPTNIVSQIWQTQDGFMWFETRSGVCRYDGYTIQVFDRASANVPERKKELRTRDAEWRREGKGRLARKGKDGSLHSWQLIPEDIIAYTRTDHFHVADVDEQTEAISTYGSGLYLYDKPSGELTRIHKDVIDNPYLTGLFVDHTGCIWVIEDYLGVKCLRMNSLHYTRHPLTMDSSIPDANHIRCIAPMGSGRMFCSNQMSDVYDYDILSHQSTFVRNSGKRVYAALTDRLGNVWIGTRGAGLFKNNRYVEDLPSANVFQLKEDEKDGIWVALFEGGVAHLRANGVLEKHLLGKNCHDMVQDKDGRWWVAAEDSVYLITKGSAKPVMWGFFVCLFRDQDDVVWAGGIGVGLVRMDDGKAYTAKSGLENSNVFSVVQDEQGWLWLGTEGGLSCINPHTDDIQNHHFSDSKLANVFSERAAVALDDGRLLMGTHDGIIEIEPHHREQTNSLPTTVVTGLLVNGSSSELDAPLSYSDNNLAFLYSNFQYSTLGSVLYQYRLDGIDKDWCPPTKEHTALYRRLPPGRYTFRVRSNNGMGIWGKEALVAVSISEPWWNRWWAWLLYIAVVASMGWFVYRVLHLRHKLDIERRVAAFKRDFYKRMERELRNPINIMQGATENVQLRGTSKTTVQSLRRGSRRMLKLMDMIQQFHLLDEMEMQVKAEQDAHNEEAEQRFRDIQRAIHEEEREFKELAPPPINAQTILIVEDDEDNLAHLSDTLNPYFRIIGTPSMEETETLVRERQPTMVLLDITTDEKGGRELTKRLKENQPHLPIVHLSSFHDDVHQLRSLRAGADEYIVKPFSGKVLLERVRRILDSAASASVANDTPAPEILTDVKGKRFLDQFQALLSQHISDENFSVEQFAAMMNLGRTQFYKRVKELTGETPVQHLQRARLEYAAHLLRNTNATIEDVMLRAGFRSPSYFYIMFRKHFGMSPKELRNNY